MHNKILSGTGIDLTHISLNKIHKFTGAELSRQLDHWLNQADVSHGPARAIIAP